MLRRTCIQKLRDANNNVVSYVLLDNNDLKGIEVIEADRLRGLLLNNELQLTNLQLDNGGYLVDTEENKNTDKNETGLTMTIEQWLKQQDAEKTNRLLRSNEEIAEIVFNRLSLVKGLALEYSANTIDKDWVNVETSRVGNIEFGGIVHNSLECVQDEFRKQQSIKGGKVRENDKSHRLKSKYPLCIELDIYSNNIVIGFGTNATRMMNYYSASRTKTLFDIERTVDKFLGLWDKYLEDNEKQLS